MASSFLLPRLSRPVIYGLGIGLTSSLLIHRPFSQRNLLFCDSAITGAASPKDWSFNQYKNDAQTPVVKKDGRMNPRAVRQITRGSIAGVICGLAVSVFSKTLALLLGLLVVGVQVCFCTRVLFLPSSNSLFPLQAPSPSSFPGYISFFPFSFYALSPYYRPSSSYPSYHQTHTFLCHRLPSQEVSI